MYDCRRPRIRVIVSVHAVPWSELSDWTRARSHLTYPIDSVIWCEDSDDTTAIVSADEQSGRQERQRNTHRTDWQCKTLNLPAAANRH